MPKYANASSFAALALAAAVCGATMLAGCSSVPETDPAQPGAAALTPPAGEPPAAAVAAPPAASPTLTVPSGPMVKLAAHLDGLGEVPPNMMGGTGDAAVTYERRTQQMRFKLAYAGLSGGASAAHFHGPSSADANGPAVVSISVLPGAPQGSVEGQATLTDGQAADLLAGRWYVNIHTVANPGGEIRGQVLPQR
jgi:hypothetical protein